MVDVFISYSRKDISFARVLYESIVSRNKEVWIDWEDIPPSTDWLQEIFSAIESADTFIFIISKNSVTSDICGLEISHAIKNSKKIIPIVIPGPNPSDIPPSLSKLNWIEFPSTTGDDFQKAFENLLQTIETDLDYVKSLTKMQNQALDWERNNHDKSRLIDGQLLESSKQMFLEEKIKKSPRPSALLLDFIAASIQNRAQKRSRTIVVSVFSLMVILAISFIAIHLLTVSRAQKMAVQAETFFNQQDFQLATLYAIRSNQISENELADHLLLSMPFENFPLAKGLSGHLDAVKDVEWSRDGTLASASSDGTIILWDLESKTPQKVLRNLSFSDFFDEEYVSSDVNKFSDIAWSNDGQLASVGFLNEFIIWDLDNQTPRLIWKNPDSSIRATKIAWAPDGKKLASTQHAAEILIWDAETGEQIKSLKAETDYEDIRAPTSLSWSDSGILAVGTSEGYIVFWDVEEAAIKHIIQTDQGAIYDLDWSAEGLLASGSENNTVSVWSLYSDEPVKVFKDNYGYTTGVSWSPTGQLASSTSDNRVILWDFETEKPVQILKGHTQSVSAIDWSANGQLASCSADSMVLLWDTNYVSVPHYFSEHKDAIVEVAWSPSEQLTSASEDGNIYIWDMATGEPVVSLNDNNGTLHNIAWSESFKLASSSGINAKGRIVVWDIEKGKPQFVFSEDRDDWFGINSFTNLAWLPNDNLIFEGYNYGNTGIWDINDSTAIQEIKQKGNKTAWSSDGQLAIGGFDQNVFLWDLENEAVKETEQVPINIFQRFTGSGDGLTTDLEWSPNGTLASGFANGEIIVWDFINKDGTKVMEEPDSNSIIGLSWSSQNVLASASNGQIAFWTTGTYSPYLIWNHPNNDITSIDWSADGRMAIGTANGTVEVSRSELTGINPCDWIFRNMTIEEWRANGGLFAIYKPVCPNQPIPNFKLRLLNSINNFDPGIFIGWYLIIWIPISSSLVIYGGVIYMFIKGKKKAGYRYKRMR